MNNKPPVRIPKRRNSPAKKKVSKKPSKSLGGLIIGLAIGA